MKKLVFTMMALGCVCLGFSQAVNHQGGVVIEYANTWGGYLNFKGATNEFWHFSGPRNAEGENQMSLFWFDGASYHRYFSVSDNGNVGIGIANPKSLLSVNGKIAAKEVKVTINPTEWSDFVFKEDYKLRNLSEVEKFIKKNNHLPEIPSEKEVYKDGIELGAMQAKLLQKIEELTLYTIEQQKTIDSFKLKFEEMESKIQK